MLSFKTFFLKNFQRTTQFLLFLGVFISTTFVFNVSPASAAVTSWNCSSYDGPIFIENENNAAEARELNLSSESYGSIMETRWNPRESWKILWKPYAIPMEMLGIPEEPKGIP